MGIRLGTVDAVNIDGHILPRGLPKRRLEGTPTRPGYLGGCSSCKPVRGSDTPYARCASRSEAPNLFPDCSKVYETKVYRRNGGENGSARSQSSNGRS